MSILRWLQKLPENVKPVATPEPRLVAYTDGASPSNGKAACRGGVGVAWLDPTHAAKNVSEPLKTPPRATNNRAELTAVIRALEVADEIDPSRRRPLLIKSDSQLCVKTANTWLKQWQKAGWVKADKREPSNLDLLKRLSVLLARRSTKLEHVAAHTGGTDVDSIHNAHADRLAVAGAKM